MIFEPRILVLLSKLHKDKERSQIIICKDDLQAQKCHKNILSLSRGLFASHDIEILPGFIQTGVFKYESAKKIITQRLKVAHHLTKSCPRLIVTSVSGFTRSFPNINWIKNHTISLHTGNQCDIESLIFTLNQYVYTEVKQVEDIGEYTVRGCILDIWPPTYATPVRIEFFDDIIQQIKLFRAHDQKSFSVLQTVDILPAREFVWPISTEVEQQIEQFNTNILRQGIEGIVRANLLEDFKSNIPFPGIDDVAYMFSKPYGSFLDEFTFIKNETENSADIDIDYFDLYENFQKEILDIENTYSSAWKNDASKNTIVGKLESVFSGLVKFKQLINAHFANSQQSHESPVSQMSRLKDETYYPSSKLIGALDRYQSKQRITFADRASQFKTFLETLDINQIVIAAKNLDSCIEVLGLLSKYFPDIENSLRERIFEFEFIKVLNQNLTDIPTQYPSKIFATVLDIDDYFFIPQSKTLYVSEHILRGQTVHSSFNEFIKPQENNTQNISQTSKIFFASQFSDFIENELVVHVQYGICRFRGLATIKIADIASDFLVLEFAGNDKIYVPISKLNLVQKYVGASASATLDSLKTKAWEKRKEKAKKDVQQLAQKLLEHHAKQVATPGTAFSKIGEDYIAFEDAFPYEDTPDQQKATLEIMNDMSQPKAMDRLLCGDVGFGKTEIAMRACYRAVLDGKQVAWLVPTTVLAHQHFRTLSERFSSFGVNVSMLDRSTDTSTKILDRAQKGEIDILIGTHRILGHDIKFRDLGLLVVDEEQHFGVLQKEKIKSMSYGIDVLTLTATPIPRTLQMALLGIRDLSLLTTPPKSRLATKTFVCPFEDKIIADAVQFELARGGQVFYVHNRVEELESVQKYLSNLLPSVRIRIGHGKMPQNTLEKIIIEFLDGKFDLFLCTTIVEAGIDMPNVNTIIIQNADFFGLAQLYQLRGRVGRRSTRGYAYFLVPEDRFALNSDGMKRLEILKDHQELGSGFLIASQDLEMRGAGEILGDEQSGKVSEIGLETYLQMLDDAIKHLGGIRIEHKTEVDLQIPLPVQIPEHYIESARERLLMYRRFFGARDESSLITLVQECEDRFGKLPEEVENLVEVSRIRRLLMSFGAISFIVGDENTECRLDQKILQSTDAAAEAFVKRVLDLCNRQSKNIRITQDGRLLFPIKRKQFIQNKLDTLVEIKKILSFLV